MLWPTEIARTKRGRLVAGTRALAGADAALQSCVAALALLAAAAWLLIAAGTAAAEVTEGRATDPVGDSLGAPSQDIVSARAQYESSGAVTVSATMNGQIASGPATFFSFAVASYSPPESCGGATVTLSGDTKGKGASMSITGAPMTGTALMFVFGNTISFTSYDENQFLANRSFSCMTLSVWSEEEGKLLDQLDTPLWFKGSGPGTAAPPISALRAPSISGFSKTVKAKRSTGVGKARASCVLPGSEACLATLTLYVTVKHGHKTARLKVGAVTGMISGGRAAKLTLKLNGTGRKYLKKGRFHAEVKGNVRSTAGLLSQFHQRLTIVSER